MCNNCGAKHSAWMGRCSNCGEWNTLVEEVAIVTSGGAKISGSKLTAASVTDAKASDVKRLSAHINEIDNVLGGGLVPGSVTLLAGQPGIGKSTLLLQLAYAVAKSASVLYVSGEESASQVGLRASRLGTSHANLQIATSNSADDIAATIADGGFKLVIVDSIQTISASAVSSAAGSVSQITNSSALLTASAKATSTALVLVGHVTKEGAIAGPKVLEHLVDVVLQLEGDAASGFKLLRATKNRFGAVSEVGIFEMTTAGLTPVANPSAALLEERQVSDGSIVLATMEGSRPLLVEVQALVNRTSYGYPKRAASGIDLNRLNLLVAVLERRTKLNLADKDIYLNIVGGIKVTEPAADLAVCLAIGSAAKGYALKENAVVFGEVGLSGEVRRVPFSEKRVAEAKKLGFKLAIGPAERKGSKSSFLSPVPDVRAALNGYLKKG